jgi:glycosyltransferase involved in cell wall biosynthesis
MDKPRHTDFEIAFEYPPNYYKLIGEKRLGMLVYETTVLPPRWTEAILEHLHVLVVPSRFCAEIMNAAGVPADMVEVVPYGIRPELFRPDVPAATLPTRKSFKFLCVAMPHKRKALDILIDAYCSEFSARDDVCLVIKSSYQPRDKRKRAWEMELEPILSGLSARPDMPEILSICRPVPIEDMPGFYAACDCYVQPSRSEGFGLAILEAFTCSKPAIVTGHGGHMQFCDESNAYILDHAIVPAGEIQYDHDSAEAFIAVPEKGHLRALMRSAYEDTALLEEKSRNALRTAAGYTWAAAAELLEETILRLKG